jgi:nitroreductase
MNIEIQILNQIIENRRSTYPAQFSNEPVKREIIEQMLYNANRAPTHAKTEPWRFVVFEGKGLQKLANFQSELYKKITPQEKFNENTYVKLQENPLKASHIIAIGMKRQETGKIPEVEEIEAVACAVQNMYLTAEAYKIGVYWGSGGITYFEEAKEFFGLGKEDKLLGFLYVGNIAKESPISPRKPIEDKVTWISEL